LCKPDFKGQVSFDPPETRFMAGLYVMMGEGKVKEWFKCMGQNQPIIQQGEKYFYTGGEAKRKVPKAPCAMVFSAPVLSFAGAIVINKNSQQPYASAL